MADAWVAWLHQGHIDKVLAAGATNAELSRVPGDEIACRVTYHFPSWDAFTAYERDHAPRLRAEGLALFPIEKGIRYHRSVDEIAS